MGEKERQILIGKAFADDALLKKLRTAKSGRQLIRIASQAGVDITVADVGQLMQKLEVGKGPTVFDVIRAISKVKSLNSS